MEEEGAAGAKVRLCFPPCFSEAVGESDSVSFFSFRRHLHNSTSPCISCRPRGPKTACLRPRPPSLRLAAPLVLSSPRQLTRAAAPCPPQSPPCPAPARRRPRRRCTAMLMRRPLPRPRCEHPPSPTRWWRPTARRSAPVRAASAGGQARLRGQQAAAPRAPRAGQAAAQPAPVSDEETCNVR
jgi:hypothetical protein